MGMISLGNIFKGITNIAKTVAPSIIKAVAPAASGLLKGVVGDLFTKGGGFLKGLASALPGPLGSLANKLLGAALPKLQGLAEKGIDSLIGKLADSITKRFGLPGVGDINLPGMPTRLPDIIANQPGGQTGSNVGAATGGGSTGGTTGTGGSAPSTNATQPAGPSGSGAMDKAPNPENYDMESIKGQAQFNRDMTKFQQALQNMQMFWQQMSNMIKAQGDTQRSLVGNLR